MLLRALVVRSRASGGRVAGQIARGYPTPMRKRKWWRESRRFLRLGASARVAYSKDANYRASLERISSLPEDIGQALDDLDAPLRVCKSIAWAPPALGTSRAEHAKRRLDVVLQFRGAHARWPSDEELKEVAATARPPAVASTVELIASGKLKDFLEEEAARAGVSDETRAVLIGGALHGLVSGLVPQIMARARRRASRRRRAAPQA